MNLYQKIQKICFYGVLLCLNTDCIARGKEATINYLTNNSVPKQLSLCSNVAFVLYACTLVLVVMTIAAMKGQRLIAMVGVFAVIILIGFLDYSLSMAQLYYFVPQLICCGFLLLILFLMAAYAANMKKLVFIGFIVMFAIWTPAFLPPIYIHW